MLMIISDDGKNVPEGYRHLTDEEVIKDYLSFDMDNDYCISKNEWMLTFIKMLGNDIQALEKEGPDAIMQKIQELSDEFERYDVDNNKYLDYEEYKAIVTNNIYISES